jgi:hypothetical protein
MTTALETSANLIPIGADRKDATQKRTTFGVKS